MKLRTLLILLFSAAVFMRCNEAERLPQYMAYYLTGEEILKVEMGNIHGKFLLNEKQLLRFKTDFLKCKTVPELAVKAGSLSMIITLKNGETYVARGNMDSEFLEVSAQIATLNREELEQTKWLVLDTKEVNFNNYRPR